MSPTAIRVLPRHDEFHTGLNQRVGFGQPERFQRVEEFSHELRVVDRNGEFQMRFEECEFVRQPLRPQPILAVVVERVDDVRDGGSEIVEPFAEALSNLG
jgi:hypothetical protein